MSTPPKRATQAITMRQELTGLLLKVAVVTAFLGLFFSFLYGVHRVSGADMGATVKDGDLTAFYRLDKAYSVGDVIALRVNGQFQVRRIVAVTGDVVDITPRGLVINGALQDELDAQQPTRRYADGVQFPLTVGPGQVFVLGDARENATDSRVYGPVPIRDTLGKVIGIVRMRDL